MAFRSFTGSCATLITSVVNLTILAVQKGEPGWICLMACNADILFCVVVLHWVTSKEQKEEDSAFRSDSGHMRTVGSARDRSRRVTVVEVDGHDEKGLAVATMPAGSGTMTTEIKSNGGNHVSTPSGLSRVLHRRGSSGDGRLRLGLGDDEVELNNIRVQTVYTREVEVDGDGKSSIGGDSWVGSRKGVVGERIV
jgi:hypothetical protein